MSVSRANVYVNAAQPPTGASRSSTSRVDTIPNSQSQNENGSSKSRVDTVRTSTSSAAATTTSTQNHVPHQERMHFNNLLGKISRPVSVMAQGPTLATETVNAYQSTIDSIGVKGSGMNDGLFASSAMNDQMPLNLSTDFTLRPSAIDFSINLTGYRRNWSK